MPLTIPANGASQAIYLDMSGSIMRYSIGTLTTPSTYTSFIAGDWPVTINNTPSPSSSNILKVVATQNLTITGGNTYYFTAGSAFITFDGSYNGVTNSTITISGIGSWLGFVYSNNKSNIGVQNFTTARTGGSTLAGGWLCYNSFGAGATGCFITNCTNNAPITGNDCGGLCGSGVASSGGVVSITNCTNNGSIGTFNGGLVGTNCALSSASSSITFTNCTNNGNVGGSADTYSGGITGYNCATNGGTLNFINCTNNGTIGGGLCGGICGQDCGVGSGNGGGSVNFTNCINTGDISGNFAGGLAGQGISANSPKASTMVGCYNVGNIRGTNAGGLFGANLGSNTGTNTRVDISGCYSIATTISATGGGIIGGNNGGTYTNNPTINITNCYAYNYTTPANSIIVAASYTKPTVQTNCYIPTTGWSDASANASLTGTPTSISTNNPGTTWTMVTAGTPYVLSAYNAALYSPNSASASTDYTSAAGLFQSGYTYQILYTGQAANVTTPRVFVSKGTAPFYKSYNSNTFALTKTVSGSISVSINSSTGVLSFVIVPFIISADGASQAIYLRMSGVSMQYSIGSLTTPSTWTTILSEYWPAPTINSNPGSSSVLKVLATEALTMSSNTGGASGYFLAGSEYVTFDGSGNTITIDTIALYPGFIENGTSTTNGYANVVVQNFTTTISGASTLLAGGGWLCQSYFGAGVSGNTITGCTNLSDGVISATDAGGIAGSNVGSGSGGVLTITNCANAAAISSAATSAGGIIGSQAGSTSGLVTITKCFSTGDITGQQAGGIAGSSFATNTSQNCIIGQCYSTGNIGGTNAGGITGSNIGYSSSGSYTGLVDISNCYSLGTIATTTGGICGGLSGVTYSTSATIRITNSYSSGALSGTGAGLVAVSLTTPNITLTTPNTFVAGGSWTDASASTSLAGTPTNLTTSNPGSTWTTIVSNTPYVLSAYNAALYSPSSASSSNNYTSAPGLFQSDYTYQIVYSTQASNVLTARVFASKGTAPSYNSYNFNTFTFTNPNGVVGSQISATINASNGVLDFILPYPCFLEGTKILCFENNEEVYRPVESLQKGDLVKTICHGYMPINMMGITNLYNPGNDYRIVNRLYKCPKENYPTLFEDLYITGCHSILVSVMTDDQWENTKAVNKTIYVTDNHFRLIACADEKAEPYNKEGFMNIYHIALDHHDIYMNYGIYANGLLVESCSIECLIYSNMKLLGKDESVVSQDGDNVFNNMTKQQQLVQTC